MTGVKGMNKGKGKKSPTTTSSEFQQSPATPAADLEQPIAPEAESSSSSSSTSAAAASVDDPISSSIKSEPPAVVNETTAVAAAASAPASPKSSSPTPASTKDEISSKPPPPNVVVATEAPKPKVSNNLKFIIKKEFLKADYGDDNADTKSAAPVGPVPKTTTTKPSTPATIQIKSSKKQSAATSAAISNAKEHIHAYLLEVSGQRIAKTILEREHDYSKPWHTHPDPQVRSRAAKFLFMKNFPRHLTNLMNGRWVPPDDQIDVVHYTDELKKIPFLTPRPPTVPMVVEEDYPEIDPMITDQWSCEMNKLWTKATKIIYSDRSSRLTFEGNLNEVLLKRNLQEQTANKFRELFSATFWDFKLCSWLNQTLLEYLDPNYRVVYLDSLQILRLKIPTLIEKIAPSPKSSATDSQKLKMASLNDPLFNTLSHYKPKKLSRKPIIIIVPHAPNVVVGESPRMKYWHSLFAAMGKLVTIQITARPNDYISDILNDIRCSVNEKIRNFKSQFSNRPIILVGFHHGSLIAVSCALQNQNLVSATICLGFPLKGINGIRGELDDPFLETTVPTQFVIGENAIMASLDDIEDFRERMTKAETALIVVGGANDRLMVSQTKKRLELLTQSLVDRSVADEIYNFLSDILQSYKDGPNHDHHGFGMHSHHLHPHHQDALMHHHHNLQQHQQSGQYDLIRGPLPAGPMTNKKNKSSTPRKRPLNQIAMEQNGGGAMMAAVPGVPGGGGGVNDPPPIKPPYKRKRPPPKRPRKNQQQQDNMMQPCGNMIVPNPASTAILTGAGIPNHNINQQQQPLFQAFPNLSVLNNFGQSSPSQIVDPKLLSKISSVLGGGGGTNNSNNSTSSATIDQAKAIILQQQHQQSKQQQPHFVSTNHGNQLVNLQPTTTTTMEKNNFSGLIRLSDSNAAATISATTTTPIRINIVNQFDLSGTPGAISSGGAERPKFSGTQILSSNPLTSASLSSAPSSPVTLNHPPQSTSIFKTAHPLSSLATSSDSATSNLPATTLTTTIVPTGSAKESQAAAATTTATPNQVQTSASSSKDSTKLNTTSLTTHQQNATRTGRPIKPPKALDI